ncbi:hypothetical protein RFI_14168 [Reticulomyxa filosa]|uniref:Uncharacterized protein n=1 Tax=Reticulomyxa filosa TaxID=46433 RepID=X6NB82_RETFI|nr:hypothetical protein RFI_14168 [Reticulomyxa filosa]|eukprot:ETO23019.1 hypothetical protein RFI_14168 [Reticulomyxa filosa]
MEIKNKVFFGLEELCVYLSDENLLYLSEYFHHLPALKRLQVIYGKKSSIQQLRYLLEHLNKNNLNRFNGNDDSDKPQPSSYYSWLSYYYNYWYYSFQMSNSCRQLQYLYLITKNTTCEHNISLLSELRSFLEKKEEMNITFLYVKLIIKFPYWDMDYLVSCVHELEQSYAFKRDTVSYIIVMPFKSKPIHKDYSSPEDASDDATPGRSAHSLNGDNSRPPSYPPPPLPSHSSPEHVEQSYRRHLQMKETGHAKYQSLQQEAFHLEKRKPLIDKNSLLGEKRNTI